MKTALIIGGSGLIGQELIKFLVKDPGYSSVILLLRKKLEYDDPRIIQHIYDFDQGNPGLIKADEIFCTLGSTIKKAGSKEQFFRIDHDYVFETAKSGIENGAKLFSLVSAMGADPKSRIFYNRTKGLLEKNIKALNYTSLHIFKPSLLLGDRNEKRLGEKLAQYLMTGLSFFVPQKYKAIEGKKVAESMWKLANQDIDGLQIVDNDQIFNI